MRRKKRRGEGPRRPKYTDPLVGDPYTLKISSAQPKLPHTAWLAGDHVYVLTPTADPLVVHLQSPPLAREYRKYFETLWRDAELIRRAGL